jgi:diamine N-acetyltransferase
LLEEKKVNLRIMEREDLPFYLNWVNDPAFFGECNPLEQETKAGMEKDFDTAPSGRQRFFIEKKDGTRIGVVGIFQVGDLWEIGYTLVSSERGKGYCSEAVTIIVDYLFLSRTLFRLQAHTDQRNVPSQKILEEVGFKKEGVV